MALVADDIPAFLTKLKGTPDEDDPHGVEYGMSCARCHAPLVLNNDCHADDWQQGVDTCNTCLREDFDEAVRLLTASQQPTE
jgi:hypothetical protein